MNVLPLQWDIHRSSGCHCPWYTPLFRIKPRDGVSGVGPGAIDRRSGQKGRWDGGRTLDSRPIRPSDHHIDIGTSARITSGGGLLPRLPVQV